MKDILRLSLPLTLWLVSFSGLYGLHGLVCTQGWASTPGLGGMSLAKAMLLAAGAVAVLIQVVAIALIGGSRYGATQGFLRSVSLSLAVVALIAAVWTSVPVVILPICQG